MSTNTLTHDTPLTSRGAQGELEFMHKLRQLLNRFGVDNACGTPDYILADLLKEHLRTWRFYATARDLHAGYPSSLNTDQAGRVVETHAGRIPIPMQRGTKGPITQHAPLTEQEKADVELAREIIAKMEKAEGAVRCFNCDGLGFIAPLKATPAPTLERWLADMKTAAASLGATDIGTYGDLIASAETFQEELNQLTIDVTKLSDQEKASILHAYDWSDDAPDNELQRAGRRLMEWRRDFNEAHAENRKPIEPPFLDNKAPYTEEGTRYDLEKGGGTCSQ